MESFIDSLLNPLNHLIGVDYKVLVLLGVIFLFFNTIQWFILLVVCTPFVIIAVLLVVILWDFQLYTFIFWVFYSPLVLLLLGFLLDVCDTYKRNRLHN